LTDVETENECIFSQPKNFNGLMNVYLFNSNIYFHKTNEWIGKRCNRKIEDIYLIDKYKNDFKIIVENALKHKSIKLNVAIKAEYERMGEKETKYLRFQTYHATTKYEIIFNNTDIDETFENIKQKLITKTNEFEGLGSNLLLIGITEFCLNIIKYDPLGVGSYIKLTPMLSNKKCIIDIQNKNDECFKYNILYHEFKNNLNQNPERVSKYKNLISKYKFYDIIYPTPIEYFDKFEKIYIK